MRISEVQNSYITRDDLEIGKIYRDVDNQAILYVVEFKNRGERSTYIVNMTHNSVMPLVAYGYENTRYLELETELRIF
jgi:hypothetical protein